MPVAVIRFDLLSLGSYSNPINLSDPCCRPHPRGPIILDYHLLIEAQLLDLLRRPDCAEVC